MNDQRSDQEAFRTLQLMNELEENAAISQRELAGRLGVAVGLVNSYLKNLTAKGWIRIKDYPRNRYAYLLTPKGFAEKSRLAYQHLSYFNSLFTVVRQDYLGLFKKLSAQGHTEVIFCGFDEVAEIAYLSMQEIGLKLNSVVDDEKVSNVFFAKSIVDFASIDPDAEIPIVVTSQKREADLLERLLKCGVRRERIITLNR